MKKNQKIKYNGIEWIGFPMRYMNISQGNNGQFSHMGVNALDICGKDYGIDPTFAPVTMKYKWNDSYANGNAIFFESVSKVRFADGTTNYATFMFIHDDYIGDILALANKGHIFKQGEEFGDEGKSGYCTGNHVHFEVAKGKFTKPYELNTKTGVWHLPNSISADKACVINSTSIINGNSMKWKYCPHWKDTLNGKMYLKSNGKYCKNETYTIDGKKYKFNKDGILVK